MADRPVGFGGPGPTTKEALINWNFAFTALQLQKEIVLRHSEALSEERLVKERR